MNSNLPSRHFCYPRAGVVAACLVLASIEPVIAAGAIVDRQSCLAELASAEEAVVRANIDSTTFRQLSDRLADMRTLCGNDDYDAARTTLRDVLNALGGSGSKS